MSRKQRKYITKETYDTIIRMHVVEKQTRVRFIFCLDLLANEVKNAIKNHFDGKQFTPVATRLRNTIILRDNIMSD